LRLSRFLSSSGIASRRACERIIAAGRVKVNRQIVTDPALDVSEEDDIEVDDQPVSKLKSNEFVYIMLHKPVGVVSTMSIGRESGQCLSDLVKYPKRVFPVGRLDMDSSGLILLTNDGNLTYQLIHPRYHVEKEYLIKTSRLLTPRKLIQLTRGVTVDGRVVEVDKAVFAEGRYIALTIHEGRKHIIHRLMREIGFRVIELKRIRIGPVHLGKLSAGRWRKLTSVEVKRLTEAVV